MIKRKIRAVTSLLLIFTLVLTQLLSTFTPPVYAASSPWSQTNWAGGSGQTAWSDATKFDSSSNIDASTTSGQTTLSVAEKLTNTGFDSNNTSWSVAAIAPSGWVEVPGDSNFSTTNFLAMKYEAKCAAASDLTTGLTSPDSGYQTYSDSGTACTSANSKAVVSVASGYPIANISHTNALTRCGTVSLNGNAAHLLRNDEYMTIARNAEAQTSNWSLGAVGSGYLFAGHNDNTPAKARIASTTDTGNNRCAYTDADPGTEAPATCPSFTAADTSDDVGNQVRTFTLSNGVVIWDIAGNVWEHVQRSTDNSGDDTTNMATLPICSGGGGWGWCQYGSTTTPYVSAWTASVAQNKVGSSNLAYNSAQGMGQVYTYGTGAGQSTSVFLRGGYWAYTTGAGAFTLDLDWGASNTVYAVGLRCASDPVEISQSYSSSSGRSAAGGNTITIGSVSDGKIYQSVNVTDTNTYNFSAYVYNNTAGHEGEAVDINIAQLYYGGNTITSPAWTAVDGETGWYKLTGTVTGVASAVDTGVLVKSGKTVIVDDISLSNYALSGTLTSSIFDSGQQSNWGPISTTATTPANTSASVTAAFSDDSSSMGTFSACTTSSCATNKRYAQYKVTLSNTDYISTPTFTNFSLPYSAYDSTPPSISLNSPTSPTTNTKPAVTGSATEDVGTVSTVEFQMDATSGSWTACTATDGSFNSATENFTCTPATALSDGSHTMYVRATDSNSNTTSNANASTKTFTVDATAPLSFDLDSPGADSYITNERPTIKWKATTDATSGLSSYSLEVDNGDSGDFSITGIPTSRTTDYDTVKYLAHYEGGYISIYTKSSSSWGSGENDGKLKEGSRSWTVKAIDNAGNERSQGRVVIVDLTSPTLSSLTISGSLGEKDSYQITTNQTPAVTGTIADTYYPDKVEIAVYKENYFLGVLTSTELITTRSQSLANIAASTSLSFSAPVSQTLDYGSYYVTVAGYDKAGNKSGTSTIYFKILTTSQARELLQGKLSKEGKKTIQEQSHVSLPALEEKAKERRVKEAAELEKTISPIAQSFEGLKLAISNFVSGVGLALQHTSKLARDGLSFIAGATQQSITGIAVIIKEVDTALGKSSDYTQQEIARVYKNIPPMVSVNQILRPVADMAILIREDVGQRLENGGQMLAQITTDTLAGIKNTSTTSEENTRKAFNNYYSGASKTMGTGISSLAFGVGEKVQNISDGAGFTIVKFGYLFVNEPTKIYDVQAIVLSPTSTKITWKTNHPANGKVNYGLDETYPLDIQTSKRTTNHEFTLTNLQPNTEYHFEVMSQNKNYVYDANRKFQTPEK